MEKQGEADGADVDADLEDLSIEEAQQKLNEVYEELRNIGGSSAEARASKILAGLGFSKVMQVISWCGFGGWGGYAGAMQPVAHQPAPTWSSFFGLVFLV